MNRSTLLLTTLTGLVSFSAFAGLPSYKPARFAFNEGEVKLTEQQKKAVDSIYNHLEAGEKAYLTLLSEAEEKLTATKKAELTYKRAEAILAACRNKQIPDKEYYAEIVPVNAPNKIRTNDLSLSSNREYMINNALTGFVFCPKEKIASSNAAVVFDPSTDKEVQKFTFDPKKDIEATLSSGTTIEIPAGSLMYPNGMEPKEAVQVHVAEYKDLDKMVTKMMTTTCDGKQLMTGGMWNIQVSCEGVPLIMKNGKSYHIKVENNSAVRNMKVFTGEMKGGMLNWKLQDDGSVSAGTKTVADPSAGNASELAMNPEVIKNNITTTGTSRGKKRMKTKNNRAYPSKKIEYVSEEDIMEEMTTEEKVEYQAAMERTQNIYDLQLNDFGWINCDAFNESNILSNLVVMGDVNNKTTCMLVYPKRKSVLPGYLCTDGKSARFDNIATDEPAMLVVFVQTGEKDAIKKYTVMLQPGQQKNIIVDMKPGSMAALQTEIRSKLSDI